MSSQEIRFEHTGHLLPDAPPPAAAESMVPAWLRAMPAALSAADRRGDDATHLTLRACLPFVDAMSMGYVLRWPSTVTLRVLGRNPGGDFRISFEPAAPAFLSAHPARQMPGMPGSELPVLKLANPWVARTPPGTACLVMPLMNRLDRPFIPCAAVVDTDTYGASFHLPFFFIPPSSGKATIERGEPFAQLVPFRREPWVHSVGQAAPDAVAETQAVLRREKHGGYARRFRQPKRFS